MSTDIIDAPMAATALPTITPDMMMSTFGAPAISRMWDGERFPGGFGYTELLQLNYWELRARSQQLYRQNLYARGIIRRLCTNLIHVGLHLEAEPDPMILGIDESILSEWTTSTETRWHLWESTPALCDFKGQKTFGALQAQAKLTALVSGDVLVVLHQDALTGLPKVRLVDGSRVQSPFGATPNEPKLAVGHSILHGVERDQDGRHCAYWIVSSDETTFERRMSRLPSVGDTGRRQAWLVYGTPLLLEEVRGEPILSILLQSLRELDRMRDAVQRKALLSGILALFIKRDLPDVTATRPLTAGSVGGGAVVRGSTTAMVPSVPFAERRFNISERVPGVILDELAAGETPQAMGSTGTDEKFNDFEEGMISAMAWSLEIPPEILKLAFSSNYSASQASIQELKNFIAVARVQWGDDLCQPIYNEYLIAEVLAGRIKADGFLEAWRDPMQFDVYAAWTLAAWPGQVKPALDIYKNAKGYELLLELGLITRDRAARETTGTKFTANVAALKRENEALAEANKALVELKNAGKPVAPAAPTAPPKRDLTVVPKSLPLPKEEDN
jgi:capsid protein